MRVRHKYHAALVLARHGHAVLELLQSIVVDIFQHCAGYVVDDDRWPYSLGGSVGDYSMQDVGRFPVGEEGIEVVDECLREGGLSCLSHWFPVPVDGPGVGRQHESEEKSGLPHVKILGP